MPCTDGLRPVAIEVQTAGEFTGSTVSSSACTPSARELREVRERALGDERIDHRPARAVDAEEHDLARARGHGGRSEGDEEQEESGAHGGLAEPEQDRPYAPAHASRARHGDLDLAGRRSRRLPRPRIRCPPSRALRRRACGRNTSFRSSRRPPFPNHVSLATCATVERHGIVANSFVDREKGRFDYGERRELDRRRADLGGRGAPGRARRRRSSGWAPRRRGRASRRRTGRRRSTRA